MKQATALFLAVLLLITAATGCADSGAVRDGRDRPSSCGQLQVLDGKLCSEQGKPVMLRGVSR